MICVIDPSLKGLLSLSLSVSLSLSLSHSLCLSLITLFHTLHIDVGIEEPSLFTSFPTPYIHSLFSVDAHSQSLSCCSCFSSFVVLLVLLSLALYATIVPPLLRMSGWLSNLRSLCLSLTIYLCFPLFLCISFSQGFV